MKCPFCQQELVRHWGMKEPALYCCDNPKCSRGGVATESSWQELIRTRKALDVAVDALKEYANEEHWDFEHFYSLYTYDKAKEALEQINQKEQ